MDHVKPFVRKEANSVPVPVSPLFAEGQVCGRNILRWLLVVRMGKVNTRLLRFMKNNGSGDESEVLGKPNKAHKTALVSYLPGFQHISDSYFSYEVENLLL